MFHQNPQFGLRDAALKIVQELKKNRQVIVDGKLLLKATRKSLVQTIKKKVPSCSILLVKLLPVGGFSQVMWSWHSSWTMEKVSFVEDETTVKKWFDSSLQKIDFQSEYVEDPKPDEGFQVQEINVPLCAQSHFKYEMPGLLIQWEALLTEQGDLHPQLPSLCAEWVKRNSCGHIVVLRAAKDVAKGRMMSPDASQSLPHILRQLTQQIGHPVYALRFSRNRPGSYSLPPQPGVLAFLQSQHLLDLHGESTVYVFNDLDHMKMAQVAGVKHLKMSTAARSSKWIVDGPCLIPAVPAMLTSMSVGKPLGDLTAPQPVRVPLYLEISENRQTLCASRQYSYGYEEHVFTESWDSFLQFQERFSSQVTPIDCPRSNLKKVFRTECSSRSATSVTKRKAGVTTVRSADECDPNIPSWMTTKLRRQSTLESTVSSSDKEDSKESASVTSLRSSRTVYLMTEKELCNIARQVLSEAGREDSMEKKIEDKDAG
ncbi:uncharacterized protein LOC101861583 isoform X2 [Aplysia californica]|nr:uncharacterized protein LOC101861583 isoform X2 [Aplysia californica]